MNVKTEKDYAWEKFLKSPPATDDFGEAILAARKTSFQKEREPLDAGQGEDINAESTDGNEQHKGGGSFSN